ncbi:hypothetical protein ABHV50_004538, partial [Vibrio vulnificus]
HCIASAVAWFWHFILRVVGFAFVVICGGECVANTRLLPRVDEWIPVCTGMTAGGADQFSHSVILANAGIHCIASAVAQFWRSIIGVVGFLVVVCGGECVANTRILARVDEWIPVCTGMTAGGADQFSHSVILANAGIHCIASAVARFYRFITGVSVDLATRSPRHPRERGDPLYSERRGSFLALHYRCYCWFCYSLTPSSSRTGGIYCIASTVAWFYRIITGVSVDLATLSP